MARSTNENEEVMNVATGDGSRFTGRMAILAGLAALVAMLNDELARADTSAGISALVMELSGTTTPPLAVHREVASGTLINLAPGAHLSLLHYATCTIVTFSRGPVAVTERGLESAEANVEKREPGPCPRTHRIAFAGTGPLGGGIVARGISLNASESADIAANGLVVITGPHASEALSADVLDSNRRLVEGYIPIRDESFRLSGSLPPKRPYFVNIRFKGRSDPMEVPISILASNAKGLLILRLE